jgi:hypothetical protein
VLTNSPSRNAVTVVNRRIPGEQVVMINVLILSAIRVQKVTLINLTFFFFFFFLVLTRLRLKSSDRIESHIFSVTTKPARRRKRITVLRMIIFFISHAFQCANVKIKPHCLLIR